MSQEQHAQADNLLGSYLRDRRTRLDPAALGFAVGRRRTPGLRREEVAQRANISPTWYTWLEQGRGGAPSADVLNRIAAALMLTDIEREHVFLLGLGRPPEVRYTAAEGVTPRLQRLLDALEVSPALIKTATWEVVAWNRAAAAVLTDYGALPPGQRNILRLIFCDPRVRAAQYDWEKRGPLRGRRVPGGCGARRRRFRSRPTRGRALQAQPRIRSLVARQQRSGSRRRASSASGIRSWGRSGWNIRRLPSMVEPDLGMIVYNPVTRSDADRIRSLVTSLPVQP